MTAPATKAIEASRELNASDPLWIQESYINATEGYCFGDSDVYETYFTSEGDLYRSCVKEYGRCTGSVYVDGDGRTRRIGWVFVGRQRYEDTGDPYLREVWVTLHDAPAKVETTYRYHEMAS